MNKKEAAQFLAVTERSLERYVSQNKLKVTYAKGKTRPIAIFNETELEKLKQEMMSMPISQRAVVVSKNEESEKTAPDNDNLSNGVIATRATSLTKRAKSENVTKRDARQSNLGMGELDSKSPLSKMLTSIMANSKMVLTLAEAAALTSISQQELRKAIHNQELKAGRKGRGWKIRRKDLEVYVEHLW